ncbi:conserved domain protein [Cellvibrio japonicus Ueda107]|uniref:Conserved domain protein n=1 Tax=Cellvibrio japonicus (strain Ueda107) TaxID=498211 RepID=B3PC91_CELJU|nr:conserved domain protein [Cellvibrio japonicus Ueda107]
MLDLKLVDFEGNASNELFETLEDWNHQLKHLSPKP